METQTPALRASHSAPLRRLRLVRRFSPLALLGFALFAAPAVALAAPAPVTPSLTGETPSIGSTQSKAPTSVKLTFSTDVSSSGSDIVIFDAKGNTVSAGPLTVKTNTMTVDMHADGNGTYLVMWHATSTNGNKPSIGAYTFAVGAASNPSGEVGSTSAAVVTPSSGAPVWAVVVAAIVGLIVGFAASRFAGTPAGPGVRPPSMGARPPAARPNLPQRPSRQVNTPPQE
jgi:methionine-rich copper-binding protein CopC